MKTVYSIPFVSHARTNPNNGIHQVIAAMDKYLPDYGYRLTENPDNADLTAHHAGEGEGKADVSICHGLHPTQVDGVKHETYQFEINARVIRDARGAKQVIVPSEWVADLFRRDMLLNPNVVQWGIDTDAWQHDYTHEGYVLWNKGRVDPVCTTEWIDRAASMLPNRRFVSTFGDNNLPNMRLVGRVPHDQMRTLIQKAGVYLATTKETGDIGSREALAAGVPVVGFNQGATPDFLQHGVNGWLAAPNDIEGLVRGIEYCLKHRAVLSANARELAKGYDWQYTIGSIARVFDQALAPVSPIKVSVVIPCYNYERYVLQAIESVAMQTTNFEFEIIVVNDGSTDGTKLLLDDIRLRWTEATPFKVIHQKNQGVAVARNAGITAAKGQYIVCLDADDMIGDGFLQKCADALDRDPHLGIAFARLRLFDGTVSNWLSQPVDYDSMTTGFNQVPTCCMFRRDDALRVGGFRQYMHPAEDGDLWLRLQTFTGKRAECVTQDALFIYRVHEASATAQARGQQRPDPYVVRASARQPQWAFQRPFAAPVEKGTRKRSNPVKNYDQPAVCFIIQGDGDWQFTVDSIENQSYPYWTIRHDDRIPVEAYRRLSPQDAPVRVNVRAGEWLSVDWLERQLVDIDQRQLKPYQAEVFGELMAGCCGNLVPKANVMYDQKDFIMVEFQDTVQGGVRITGATTGINYQKHKFGDQFLMHKNDVAAQPHRFKPVPQITSVTVEVKQVTEDAPPPVLLEVSTPVEDAPLVLAEEMPKVKPRAKSK